MYGREGNTQMKALYSDGTVREAEDGLSVLRHTTSHILAQAVKRLWPETKLATAKAASPQTT